MCDILFAAQIISWKKHSPNFWKAKGYSIICLNRCPHYFSRISVDTGGDINAKHGFSAFVYQLNDITIQALNIPRETGAENCIHDRVAVKDICLYGINRFNLLNFYRQPGYNVKVSLCRTFEPFVIA